MNKDPEGITKAELVAMQGKMPKGVAGGMTAAAWEKGITQSNKKYQSRYKVPGAPWGPWKDALYVHGSVKTMLSLDCVWVTIKQQDSGILIQWRWHPGYPEPQADVPC